MVSEKTLPPWLSATIINKKVPLYSLKVSVLLWSFLMYSGRSSMSKSPVIN